MRRLLQCARREPSPPSFTHARTQNYGNPCCSMPVRFRCIHFDGLDKFLRIVETVQSTRLHRCDILSHLSSRRVTRRLRSKYVVFGKSACGASICRTWRRVALLNFPTLLRIYYAFRPSPPSSAWGRGVNRAEARSHRRGGKT
jgi:hypothetical protein